MLAKKTLLAAAALAALTATGLGSANAQPRDHYRDRDNRVERHVVIQDDFRRPIARPYVSRTNVFRTLRMHRYTGLGNPYFWRGQYVVRSHNRFGRVVLVRIDPWTGRFIGVTRI
jgi:hypothetical protein